MQREEYGQLMQLMIQVANTDHIVEVGIKWKMFIITGRT
jgi:hypothetical protein